MLINTNNLPVNLAGERLRHYCFSDGGYCPQVSATLDKFTFPTGYERANLITKFGDYFDLTQIDSIKILINCSEKIKLVWQSDGDCTLIIVDGGNAYINGDCKKANNWIKICLA